MKIALTLGLLLLALLLLVPTASFVYEAGAPGACARCHEMAVPVDQWAGSATAMSPAPNATATRSPPTPSST